MNSRGKLKQQHAIRNNHPYCGENEPSRYGKHPPPCHAHAGTLYVVNRQHETQQGVVGQIPVQDVVRNTENPLLQPVPGCRHFGCAARDGQEDGHAVHECAEYSSCMKRLFGYVHLEDCTQGVQEAADARDVREEDDERQGVVRFVQTVDDLAEQRKVFGE